MRHNLVEWTQRSLFDKALCLKVIFIVIIIIIIIIIINIIITIIIILFRSLMLAVTPKK